MISCSWILLIICFSCSARSQAFKKQWRIFLAAFPFLSPPGTSLILNRFYFIELYGAHIGTKFSTLSYDNNLPTNLNNSAISESTIFSSTSSSSFFSFSLFSSFFLSSSSYSPSSSFSFSTFSSFTFSSSSFSFFSPWLSSPSGFFSSSLFSEADDSYLSSFFFKNNTLSGLSFSSKFQLS